MEKKFRLENKEKKGINEKITKKLISRNAIRVCLLFILIISMFSLINFTSIVSAQEVKSCCERTKYGAWCMNAPENECDYPSYRKVATSCEAVSFCKLGCCYDSSEGLCMENTAQKVCDLNEGTWQESKECEIPQCNLGCCVLGTQAAYVTLTRCKKLSSFYGLITDFRASIGNELECISLASLADEGACIFELDYGAKTCEFSSRQGCNSITEGMKLENGTVTGKINFYKDYLCTADELGTNCGPTTDTTCVDGKDEVYFKDSCGNPANIYDSSKTYDKDASYWRKKITKAESCGNGQANINSRDCGNCDYFSGSICKDYKKANTRPTYGNNICIDLNCKETSLGKAMKHGESWCSTDKYADSVGSRYFRHLCMNGEEIIEPCSDFRQEQCIQDKIETSKGDFSQAACRVNRWQDCYSQTEKIDCENTDKRDCKWLLKGKEEVEYEMGEEGEKTPKEIACMPLHSPGLNFWEEGESQGICSQANVQCIVSFEKKGLIGGSEKCEKNCECLEDSWKMQQLAKCEAIGDCGAKINWVGKKGNKEGYKIITKSAKSGDSGGGGLLGLHLVLDKLGMGKAVGVEVKDIEKEKI